MILFGTGGIPEAFYKNGETSSIYMPKFLNEKGLTAYEYSMKKGISISEEGAELIKENCEKYNISLSVHAPYEINLAYTYPEVFEKSLYLAKRAMYFSHLMGAKFVVFHLIGGNNITRLKAFENASEVLNLLLDEEMKKGYNLMLCPEIMGKECNFGNLEEIVKLCMTDSHLMPAINMGHLNARTKGGLKTIEDFDKISKKVKKKLGNRGFHIHFSKISYTNQGEKEHLTFKDNEYGPSPEIMIDSLIKNDFNGTVICESYKTQDIDAVYMKEYYESKNNG